MRVRHAIRASTFLALPIFAQPVPPMLKLQDQACTTEKGDWVFLPLGPEPVLVKPRGKPFRRVPLATEGLNFGYRSTRHGQIFDVRRVVGAKEGKLDEHIYLLRTPIETTTGTPTWEKVAEIDVSAGEPHLVVPLDKEGLYLAYGPFRGFHKDGQASPVAIFRTENGYLRLDDLVELPWGGRKSVGTYKEEAITMPGGGVAKGADGKPRIHRTCEIQPRALAPNLLLPAILNGHMALGASRAGVIWFISLVNGRCTRMVDLGKVSPDGIEKIGHVDHFLLGVQPDREQNLVVLTRSKDVLAFAQGLYSPPGVPMEVRQANRERFKETMQGFTDLHWWRVDPESGSTTEFDEPSAMPARSVSYDHQGLVRFIIGPEGRIYANTHGAWSDVLEKLGVRNSAPGLETTKTPEKPSAGKSRPARASKEPAAKS